MQIRCGMSIYVHHTERGYLVTIVEFGADGEETATQSHADLTRCDRMEGAYLSAQEALLEVLAVL